ncbi:hypothetical protein, partial [Phytoactinopolyspora endophytica]|uniref:hypothetical protein n=1 Tax=Phytoactinopolyspora endophytica TaxID=1642495 RepID=UPI00197C96CA
VETTTPTGHTYRSSPPPAPGTRSQHRDHTQDHARDHTRDRARAPSHAQPRIDHHWPSDATTH